MPRRTVLAGAVAGAGLVGAGWSTAPAAALAGTRVAGGLKALAFDGFTIFDPRPVTAAVVAQFPDQGKALAAAWTGKLFALSWLETAAGRYSGFDAVADAALAYSAESLSVPLSPAARRDLVGAYRRLPLWPDARAGLEKLRAAGFRLAFLSNLGADALVDAMRRNAIDELMEPPISTDRVRAFKPSPRAYAMAPDVFGVSRDAVGFVAFGGWDALGATWFGYRTAWLNRLGVPAETLSPAAEVTSTGFDGALRLAGVA